MPKPRKKISAKRKKTSSAKSRRKSAVLSALASLEPFSGKAVVAAAQEGLQAFKEKRALRTFRVVVPAPLKPKEIFGIRSSLNASQAVFASYLWRKQGSCSRVGIWPAKTFRCREEAVVYCQKESADLSGG